MFQPQCSSFVVYSAVLSFLRMHAILTRSMMNVEEKCPASYLYISFYLYQIYRFFGAFVATARIMSLHYNNNNL